MKHFRILLSIFTMLIAINMSGQITMNPCIENTAFKVVVIGSSTAAGAGVTSADSAWVNRYRKALKNINPANEVINLAVGGYTTYRLMPTGYSTPSNRPSVDTLRNITAALEQNPDVIILNLPSNDRQWPMNEQLSNFDSINSLSWNSAVPIYICTTQPVASITWAAYQWAVHDSIVAKFSPYYLEFFTPLADSNNTLDTNLTPDGTHPNDEGHRLLFKQVWNKDILIQIYSPPNYPDLSIRSVIDPGMYNHCNDSLAQLGWVIANIGDSVSSGIIGYSTTSLSGIPDSVSIYSMGLGTCAIDTLWTSNNLYFAGTYDIIGRINISQDSNISNNVLKSSYKIVDAPIISFNNDTVCLGDSGTFSANLISGDTMLWYAHISDTIPMLIPPTYIPNVQSDSVLYVQGVRGSLKFTGKLETNSIATINYNGNMFNLVAKEDIVIRSFKIRIATQGMNPYNIYTKSGKYQGYENTSSAWTLLINDSVNVNNAEDFVTLVFPAISMNSGDTLGVYIQMQGWAYQLRYASVSQPMSYLGPQLEYYSGAGISYSFGTVYPNRVLNLKVNYEYGFNPLGECATLKTPVSIVISKEKLNLGLDSTISIFGDTIYAPKGFTNHIWVNLNTGDTISILHYAIIDSTMMNQYNKVEIACYAIDKWACDKSDTIVYTMVNIHNSDYIAVNIKVYPNPINNILHIESSVNIGHISIYDNMGRLVKEDFVANKTASIQLGDLPKGLYVLSLNVKGKRSFYKLIRI